MATGFVGKVGTAPEVKSTSKGNVLEFSFAVNDGWGESKVTTWYSVSVWDEKLIASCKKSLMVGATVTVEGKTSTREYNGKTYHSLNAYRVGLIDYLERTLREGAAPAPAKTEPVQDEMPF